MIETILNTALDIVRFMGLMALIATIVFSMSVGWHYGKKFMGFKK